MLEEVLKKYWGHDRFRPLQKEIALSVIEGNDTLALLPTGGGKSICFQVPAIYMGNLCLVVSPLIALMKDQVVNLLSKGIPADMVFSGMSHKEIDLCLENACKGKFKFLYVSPERLKTEIFQERLKRMKISMIAVDEAHCISQWGYDFRPSYLEIGEVRKLLPDVPVLALTATATPQVADDIMEKLCFKDNKKVFRKSFARENIAFVVREVDSKEKATLEILQKISGTSIVYTRNRNKTEEFAKFLNQNGLVARFYHAGMSHYAKESAMNDWLHGRAGVMVATNAFGMGIDKPDVRMVVHLDVPDSPEAYYQEAGRGGRDGEKAFAVLLNYKADEKKLQNELEIAYPEPKTMRLVYQQVANYLKLAVGSGMFESFDFDLVAFCDLFSFGKKETFYALKRLEENGYLQYQESVNQPANVFFTCSVDQLYEYSVKESNRSNANAKLNADVLVKWLLRKFGGEMFTDYVFLDLKTMAKELFCDEKSIIDMLNHLKKLELCDFSAPKIKPQLVFLQPRRDAAQLSIDQKRTEWLKKSQEARVSAMIGYLNEEKLCRNLFFQHYFGEQTTTNCGICDICLRRKHAELNARIKKEIVDLLSVAPMGLEELYEQINAQKKNIDECFKELVAVEKVAKNEKGCFELKIKN